MTPRRAELPLSAKRGVVKLPPHGPGLKIGLLGGSFNPPHEAHRAVSQLALRRLGLIAPAGVQPSSTDLRLLELIAAMRAAGLTESAGFHIDGVAVYRDAVERLVNDELARIVEPVLQRHDPATLRDLVHGALPLANQLLTLLHQRAVAGEVLRWIESGSLEEHAGTA